MLWITLILALVVGLICTLLSWRMAFPSPDTEKRAECDTLELPVVVRPQQPGTFARAHLPARTRLKDYLER